MLSDIPEEEKVINDIKTISNLIDVYGIIMYNCVDYEFNEQVLNFTEYIKNFKPEYSNNIKIPKLFNGINVDELLFKKFEYFYDFIFETLNKYSEISDKEKLYDEIDLELDKAEEFLRDSLINTFLYSDDFRVYRELLDIKHYDRNNEKRLLEIYKIGKKQNYELLEKQDLGIFDYILNFLKIKLDNVSFIPKEIEEITYEEENDIIYISLNDMIDEIQNKFNYLLELLQILRNVYVSNFQDYIKKNELLTNTENEIETKRTLITWMMANRDDPLQDFSNICIETNRELKNYIDRIKSFLQQ